MGKIILTLLFFGLILTLNTGFAASNNSVKNTTSHWEATQLTTNTNSQYAAGSTSSNTNTAGSTSNVNIKVLVYNGIYSAYSCVNGIKTSLISANSKKLVPGYTFTYATSTVINSATLYGYDVLIMPGGSSGYDYIHSKSIDGTAIKKFVASGKGYIGICAGAYSGSYMVRDYYYGWGIAPHVRCIHPYYEGNLTIYITSTGQQILGTSGTQTLAYYNGPAMYATRDALILATYADNTIDSKGYAAIVGDTYGKGRVILSGPHPELDPQHPSIVASLIAWAANKTNPKPTNAVTLSQISSTAAIVKYYYEEKKFIPTSLSVNHNQIFISQFIYLLAKGIININNKDGSSITIKSVEAATPLGTYRSGTLNKYTYLTLANKLINFIITYKKAPSYQPTSLGKISFTKLVYMYSKIINFYSIHKRLPNYVNI